MPFVSSKSNLTANNARASDVAQRLTEHITPLAQQRSMSAFRVQGIQAVLLNRLTQGKPCTCTQKNSTALSLSPDGKASPGAINRILTGGNNFGISGYHTDNDPDMEFDPFHDHLPTPSPDRASGVFGTVNNKVGWDEGDTTDLYLDPVVGDNGQFSPDLDDMFGNFDMSQLGLTDVSCPICFGSTYVGGYSMFRGFRKVLVPTDFTTSSFVDPTNFQLSPGTHTATVVLPRGAVSVDAFRAMLQSKVTPATFTVDGVAATSSRLLSFCDGRPHTLAITCNTDITHFEMQFSLSKEPVYFEIPKLSNSGDISLLEPTEPFQILMSPDVPVLNRQDIIIESQNGHVLIVGQTNPWNTKNRQILGTEAQVRVAQPQELWNILSFRRPLTGQKPVNLPRPSQSKTVSGFQGPAQEFSF
jgi:hypothetical protein